MDQGGTHSPNVTLRGYAKKFWGLFSKVPHIAQENFVIVQFAKMNSFYRGLAHTTHTPSGYMDDTKRVLLVSSIWCDLNQINKKILCSKGSKGTTIKQRLVEQNRSCALEAKKTVEVLSL